MRKYRFATERKNLRVGSSVKMSDFEAGHALKTLRLRKDDEIYLFNGEKEFKAKLTLVSKDAVMAEIIEEIRDLRVENKLEIHLYLGIPRTKTFEEIIEKLTELGVSKFIPVECEYSVIKLEHIKNKYERWNKIILSACKQSERVDIPEITEGQKFSEMVENLKSQDFNKIYFMTLRQDSATKLKHINSGKLEKIAIVIGPEGGFSPKEHQLAKENGLEFTEMFDSVLRVETAAIAAVSIVKYLHE